MFTSNYTLRGNIDEDLPEFFKVLSALDQKRLYCRELFLRSFNMTQWKNQDLETLRTMKTQNSKSLKIFGFPNYDILFNTTFTDEVNFIQAEHRNTHFETDNSALMVNLLLLGEQKFNVYSFDMQS